MIVLDSSGAVELLLRTEGRGEWLASRYEADDVHAPHLFDYEVVSALRRLLLAGEMSRSRAAEAVHDLGELRITRYPAAAFVGRIWSLRRTLTAYDASYVALAEALRVPLVTTDLRLARSHGHRAVVEVYPG